MRTRAQQVLSKNSGAGGRWLVLESLSRAVNLAYGNSSTGTHKARAAAKAAASRLAILLACVATFELHLRPHAFSEERGDLGSAGAVGATGILRYLRVSATQLPRPKHPWSLLAEDHLTVPVAALSASDDDASASCAGSAAVITSPLLGDVLVSVLKATAAVSESTGSGAVWGAVSTVVLEGYERRPLAALAAVAINAVSLSELGRDSRRSARQQKRSGGSGGGVDAKVVAATRALCVAATFVRAAAEAAVAGDSEESMAAVEKDLVAVFPAALLAVASDNKVCSPKFGILAPSSHFAPCLIVSILKTLG